MRFQMSLCMIRYYLFIYLTKLHVFIFAIICYDIFRILEDLPYILSK